MTGCLCLNASVLYHAVHQPLYPDRSTYTSVKKSRVLALPHKLAIAGWGHFGARALIQLCTLKNHAADVSSIRSWVPAGGSSVKEQQGGAGPAADDCAASYIHDHW